MKWLITVMVSLSMLLTLATATVVYAKAAPITVAATAAGDESVDVSSGIPLISSDRVAAKMNKINDEVFDLANKVVPKAAVVLIVILLFLAIIIRRAWVAVLAVFLGLIFVLWGKEIMGWILHFKYI
jgi:hypothetical protein